MTSYTDIIGAYNLGTDLRKNDGDPVNTPLGVVPNDSDYGLDEQGHQSYHLSVFSKCLYVLLPQ